MGLRQPANDMPLTTMEPITGPLRNIILGALGITALICVSLYFFEPVEGMLIYDPFGTRLIHIFAYASAVFVVLGLMCIFWTKIRRPVAVALGFYVMLFLCVCVLVKIRESAEYKRHEFNQAEVRYCTVTKHKLEGDRNLYLNLLFDGEEDEVEFSDNNGYLPFYENVCLDDRARAQCIRGSLGILYIVSLHRTDSIAESQKLKVESN